MTKIIDSAKRAALATSTYLGGGTQGLLKLGGFGLGVGFETYFTGREYGYGAGAVIGTAYSIPGLGPAMMLYSLGKMAGDMAYDYQKNKRRTSFVRGFQDPFATAATMRQRSQHNLSRGRTALGSEAYLFHS